MNFRFFGILILYSYGRIAAFKGTSLDLSHLRTDLYSQNLNAKSLCAFALKLFRRNELDFPCN